MTSASSGAAADGADVPAACLAPVRPLRRALVNLLLVGTIVLLAGLTPVAAKDAMTEMPPLSAGALRFSLAGALLLLTLRLWPRLDSRPRVPIARKDWGLILGAALLCVPLNQACFLVGVKWSNSSHAGLMYGLTPVLVYLLSLLFGLVRVSRRMVVAVVLAVLGAAVLSWDGVQLGHDLRFFLGDLLLFGAVLTWALYSLAILPLVRRYGPLRPAAYVVALGAVLYLPVLLVDGHRLDFAALSARAVGGFLYISILTSCLNYFLWFVALQRIDINRLTISTNASPIVAVLAAFAWRGEPLTHILLLGAVLILAAISLANWDRLRALLRGRRRQIVIDAGQQAA